MAAAASAEGDLARQAAGSALQPVDAQALNGPNAAGPPLNQGGHHNQPPAAVSPGSFEMQSSLLALAHGSFPNEPMRVGAHLTRFNPVCAHCQDKPRHQRHAVNALLGGKALCLKHAHALDAAGAFVLGKNLSAACRWTAPPQIRQSRLRIRLVQLSSWEGQDMLVPMPSLRSLPPMRHWYMQQESLNHQRRLPVCHQMLIDHSFRLPNRGNMTFSNV